MSVRRGCGVTDPSDDVVRLAMWSGPRNISTALMRSWENRSDSIVVDEPLYAHYLAATGIDHPGRDEVVAAGDTDWRAVVGRTRSGRSSRASASSTKSTWLIT